VILLAEAGYTRTSSALSFIKSMSGEHEYLVWFEIAESLRRLLDTWWEQPEEILEGVRRFARSLFGPLVEKVGFVHLPDDDIEARQFRVLAIAAAAASEVPEFVFFPSARTLLLLWLYLTISSFQSSHIHPRSL
jgi:aminopeptidase 2